MECALEPTKLLTQRDIYGNTSLHLAVLYRTYDISKLLLENGANPDIQNEVKRKLKNRVEKQR